MKLCRYSRPPVDTYQVRLHNDRGVASRNLKRTFGGTFKVNIFIMVDMEGISGICRKSQVLPEGEHYEQGRRYLTWDVNACVSGCFEGGAAKVTVRDAHGGGYHLIWEELDRRASYIQGSSPEYRMPGIADYDGLILLGYHAMAGTPRAVLEHTMSSRHWQNFLLNGKPAGEVAIDAGIAGDSDVPLIMVSGDDKLCAEAKVLLPETVAVETKQGLDVEGAIPRPLAELYRSSRLPAIRR